MIRTIALALLENERAAKTAARANQQTRFEAAKTSLEVAHLNEVVQTELSCEQETSAAWRSAVGGSIEVLELGAKSGDGKAALAKSAIGAALDEHARKMAMDLEDAGTRARALRRNAGELEAATDRSHAAARKNTNYLERLTRLLEEP